MIDADFFTSTSHIAARGDISHSFDYADTTVRLLPLTAYDIAPMVSTRRPPPYACLK